MRRFLIAASVLVVASSSLLAAPKKKKKTPAADKSKGKDKGKGGDEIEMDDTPAAGSGSSSATKPDEPPAPTTPPPEATPAPAVPSTRPLAINDRPLTIGKGQVEVHGAIPITVLPFVDLAGNQTTTTYLGLTFGGTYGVDDKLELGGDYGITMSPGDLKGPLVLHGVYTASTSAKLDLAVGGAFILHPISAPDTMGGSTTSTYAAFQIGAWLRYRVAPKVSLFTGLPATPHPDVSMITGQGGTSGIGFPPVPYQLTVGLNNNGAIALAIPVGVGFQAAPEIYAFVSTTLAAIKIAHTNNKFFGADFAPFTIGGYYSLAPAKLDIGALFGDDLKQPGKVLNFTIAVRYFLK